MQNTLPQETTLKEIIEEAWQVRNTLSPVTKGPWRDSVEIALDALNSGSLRIAEKVNGPWKVNEWLKKAVLLSFRLNPMTYFTGGPKTRDNLTPWYDKVPSKFEGWTEEKFKSVGFRAVPGCLVRHSAYIARDVVLMPSYVNVGAYVDEGTMVDTWATIGTCAQIGKNCHISGGTGIGGVLEPLQAAPVIIEDNCFIGARSEIAEGVIVEEGAVISMGVFLGASTKIVDRETGEITYGRVPKNAVVVPGTLPGKHLQNGAPGPNLACAVIIKYADERTRSKTSLNELLRA